MAETTVRTRGTRAGKKEEVVTVQPTTVAVQEEVYSEVEETVGVIAIDNGGQNTKVLNEIMERPATFFSRLGFGSDLGVWSANTTKDDGETHSILYQEEYYFSGLLLHQAESELNGFVDNKDDDYFILNILRATALYGFDVNYLATCVPISQFKLFDDNIVRKLKGKHSITINNVLYEFEIAEAHVFMETVSGAAYNFGEGITRWLDLGSRTVGYATSVVEDGYPQVLKGEGRSGTIEKEGLNIKKVTSWKAYVNNITKVLRKWDKEDRVVVFGGGAMIEPLIDELRKYFPNLEVAEDPLFLQVKGLLELGMEFYEKFFAPIDGDDNE